ncbi:hypothetical protein [Marinobacterium aestuariivivens]|uniref:Uncharacterized protein n=1 Tax=Marinobacterium aestuariivivens TaxID=1698799 RepID=A0ABW2A626_9GAMM
MEVIFIILLPLFLWGFRYGFRPWGRRKNRNVNVYVHGSMLIFTLTLNQELSGLNFFLNYETRTGADAWIENDDLNVEKAGFGLSRSACFLTRRPPRTISNINLAHEPADLAAIEGNKVPPANRGRI